MEKGREERKECGREGGRNRMRESVCQFLDVICILYIYVHVYNYTRMYKYSVHDYTHMCMITYQRHIKQSKATQQHIVTAHFLFFPKKK